MWIWIGLVIAFIVLAISACVSDIEIHFHFNKIQKDDNIAVKIRMLYGLIKLRYDIRQIKYKGLDLGFFLKKSRKDNVLVGHESQDKLQIDWDKVQTFLENAQILLRHTEDLTRWIKNTLIRFRCNYLVWSTQIGFNDAADTAVASGFIWSGKGLLVGGLSHLIKLQKMPELSVQPHFNSPQFSTELRCIAKIRFGYAIFAGVILLVRVVKVKGGLKSWQSTLFKG